MAKLGGKSEGCNFSDFNRNIPYCEEVHIPHEIQEALAIPWWLSRKEFACSAGDSGSIPGSGRSPGEGNSNPLHFWLASVLAWRIPWTEEMGGLQSMGSQKDRHNLVAKQHHQNWKY